VDARIRHFHSYLFAKGDLSAGDDRILGISVAMDRGTGENRAIMKVVDDCAQKSKDFTKESNDEFDSCLGTALDDQRMRAIWERMKHCAEVEKQLPF
jgi:hypothetical protein